MRPVGDRALTIAHRGDEYVAIRLRQCLQSRTCSWVIPPTALTSPSPPVGQEGEGALRAASLRFALLPVMLRAQSGELRPLPRRVDYAPLQA
jgi:hypothetical protein